MHITPFVPEHPEDLRRWTPDGAHAPSVPATNLLTLAQDSLRRSEQSGDRLKGSSDYYMEAAQAIVGYAHQNPAECVRFLHSLYLPRMEGMSEKRRQKTVAVL